MWEWCGRMSLGFFNSVCRVELGTLLLLIMHLVNRQGRRLLPPKNESRYFLISGLHRPRDQTYTALEPA